MKNCPVCYGTKVVQTESPFGVTFGPCPNCNENYKRRKREEYEALKRGSNDYEKAAQANQR